MKRTPHNKGKITPSKIIEADGYSKIELCNRQGEVVAHAFIDTDDTQLAEGYRWHQKLQRGKPYVYTHNSITLHGKIMGGKGIDHINRNGLDNRRKNLRFADDTLQNINKGLQSNNKSGIKGVYYRLKTVNGIEYHYWASGISIKGRKMQLYCGNSKTEAIKRRKEAEDKYFKNYGK